MSETVQAEITESIREVNSVVLSMSPAPLLPELPSTILRTVLRFPAMSLGITLPKPVFADDAIRFNLNAIERDRFYEVEYEGRKYIIRLTKDGMLENYEVELA